MGVLVSEAPDLETGAANSVPRSPSAMRAEADIAPRPQASVAAKPPTPEAEAELAPMYYI